MEIVNIIGLIQTILSVVFFGIQVKLLIDLKKRGKSLSNMIREGRLHKLLMWMAGSYLVMEIIQGVFYNDFSVFQFLIWLGLFTIYFLRYRNKI